MAVITLIKNREEESGKSLSAAAIATNMAIGNNFKTLLISTTNGDDKINPCFFEETQVKKIRLGIFGENKNNLDTENGIEGIAKMARSNKLTPEMITNYTKVVFKERLEFLPGKKKSDVDEENVEEIELVKEIEKEYVDLVSAAAMSYDQVIVDLDNNLSDDIRKRIMDMSDLIIVCSSQNYKSLQAMQEDKELSQLLLTPKGLLLIGRYDNDSKYNAKNITRFLNEKNKILTIPYNTLFFEASNEASVPDLFLKLRKISDSEDKNAFFIEEVKRTTESILYRLQEVRARY